MTDQGAPAGSEVSWQLDGITMYGTLVRPEGAGPFPAVVMVAGSGPTDRDWNSPLLPGTNGSARLLAEALAGAGFASLRYDKRASGPHVAENLPAMIGKISMQSHADELGAVQVSVRSIAFVPSARPSSHPSTARDSSVILQASLQLSQIRGLGASPRPCLSKTVEESARNRGYYAHKCVKGRKRRLLVDTLGLPIAWYVTPADVHDTVSARKLLGGLTYFVPRLQ